MFRGNCPTRLDEKGRLKLPADFKHEIEKKGYDGQFYITSLDGKVIKLFPLKEWEIFEGQVFSQSTYEERERFSDVTSYYGQRAELDAQGRLTIAEWLREKFGLGAKGEMAAVGKVNHIDLRIMDELRKSVEENPLSKTELNAMIRPRN
ncbi:MAG: division/cell wall cluster transcriptional repressor MraZ [Terracidiphilus sp.]